MRGLKQTPAMQKAYGFALEVVDLAAELDEKRAYVMSKQILRCGTSIGANIAEAQGGISTADLSAKMAIAYKEALETKYWLNLLFDKQYISEEKFELLFAKLDEICRIVFTVLKKTRYTHLDKRAEQVE